MLAFERIFLVRHGDYDTYPSQELTEKGKQHSARALEELIRREVGNGALLLSSTAPRALQTAGIIGEGLSLEVNPSKRIEIIGNAPEGMTSFDIMLAVAISEAGQPTGGEGLVIVTHKPLIQIAARQQCVNYGDVYQYEPNTWENPEYRDFKEQYLASKLESAGLSSSVTQ